LGHQAFLYTTDIMYNVMVYDIVDDPSARVTEKSKDTGSARPTQFLAGRRWWSRVLATAACMRVAGLDLGECDGHSDRMARTATRSGHCK
jgi:hypothetical protein